jgi:hypothetical protein
MAKKTIRVSDLSGATIEDGSGATLRVTYDDARRGSIEMDLTVSEAQSVTQGKGRSVLRRGRRPKSS